MKLKPIPQDTVVHTPTEAEAKELLAILHENGYVTTNSNPLAKNIAEIRCFFHDKICFDIDSTKHVCFHKKQFYEDLGWRILTLADFKCLYCEAEKPQPKFKVGDRVWAKIYQDEPPYIGTVTFIRKDKDYEVDIDAFSGQINKQVWCCRASDLEPYTEPETKPTEDMETKELDLYELLKYYNGTIYSVVHDADVEFKLANRYIGLMGIEYYSNGSMYDVAGRCLLYPSRALYEQYPLDPYAAWMKWQEEQTIFHIRIEFQPYEERGEMKCGNMGTLHFNDLKLRTPADRDKCIEEIKAIIEKYSK